MRGQGPTLTIGHVVGGTNIRVIKTEPSAPPGQYSVHPVDVGAGTNIRGIKST